jgi:hypothetical protein
MAIRSGLASQLGMVAESTYGTAVTVTRFLEMVTEGLKLNIERVESKALRAGNRVLRTDRWAPNKKGAEGDLELEVASKGFGLLFKHMLGAVNITTPGGATLARLHTHTVADLYGSSLTVQIGRPGTGGTVIPFTYDGCKVTGWELTSDLDDVLMLKVTLDAHDEAVTTPALASASYAASDELLYFSGGAVTIGGVAYDLTKFSLTGNNGLKTDRTFIRSDTRKKEPVAAEMAEFTGEMEMEFADATAYSLFTAGTVSEIEATWTGSIIEAALAYSVTVTIPNARYDGDTPNVGGPDVVPQTIPFKALYNGTDSPVTIAYQTTDTAS